MVFLGESSTDSLLTSRYPKTTVLHPRPLAAVRRKPVLSLILRMKESCPAIRTRDIFLKAVRPCNGTRSCGKHIRRFGRLRPLSCQRLVNTTSGLQQKDRTCRHASRRGGMCGSGYALPYHSSLLTGGYAFCSCPTICLAVWLAILSRQIIQAPKERASTAPRIGH